MKWALINNHIMKAITEVNAEMNLPHMNSNVDTEVLDVGCGDGQPKMEM